MKIKLFLTAIALPLAAGVLAAGEGAATTRVVEAANAFLETLDEKQRASVVFAFDDRVQRARWSNFPTGFVPRGGISLQQMTAPQRAAALALMATVLSAQGYEKVQEIMEADDVFKATAQGPGARGGAPHGPRGGPSPAAAGDRAGPPPVRRSGGGLEQAMFGKDLYYISFLGSPSQNSPWMLQFGGHHLALNITMSEGAAVLTPTLTGAQPATYTINGKTMRPLAGENDKAYILLNSLDTKQREQAILKYRVPDLVLGPGRDGVAIQPEGLRVSDMSESQRALVLDLISQWSGIVNDALATGRRAAIKSGLNETWFAWSGATTVEPGKNGSAYYRLQGPKLVIEYAPQPGEDHVHTMYRDPTNDYGLGPNKS